MGPVGRPSPLFGRVVVTPPTPLSSPPTPQPVRPAHPSSPPPTRAMGTGSRRGHSGAARASDEELIVRVGLRRRDLGLGRRAPCVGTGWAAVRGRSGCRSPQKAVLRAKKGCRAWSGSGCLHRLSPIRIGGVFGHQNAMGCLNEDGCQLALCNLAPNPPPDL